MLAVHIGDDAQPDGYVVPAEVIAAVVAAGQSGGHGWAEHGSEPGLGYDAQLTIGR